MWKCVGIMAILAVAGSSCRLFGPPAWDGPMFSEPRTELTVDQLLGNEAPPFVDMSFFVEPETAELEPAQFSGSISFAETHMRMKICFRRSPSTS